LSRKLSWRHELARLLSSPRTGILIGVLLSVAATVGLVREVELDPGLRVGHGVLLLGVLHLLRSVAALGAGVQSLDRGIHGLRGDHDWHGSWGRFLDSDLMNLFVGSILMGSSVTAIYQRADTGLSLDHGVALLGATQIVAALGRFMLSAKKLRRVAKAGRGLQFVESRWFTLVTGALLVLACGIELLEASDVRAVGAAHGLLLYAVSHMLSDLGFLLVGASQVDGALDPPSVRR
jgi:hypothetical protein